jgi:lysophospholipase L1-like esterase
VSLNYRQLLALLNVSSGVVADVDVTAYAAAVVTAGGSLPAAHQTALNTYMPALKASGAWALIKEMHVALGNDGDLTTALVKFKNGATSPSLTHSNLVSGDYTVLKGIDPGVANSTKKVFTDFAPSSNGGFTSSNWGVSSYATRMVNMANGMMMGMQSNTGMYLGFTGSNGQSKIGGATAMSLTPVAGASEQFKACRLMTVQINAGTGQCYYGGWLKNSVVQGSPTLPAGAIQVAGGSTFFSDSAFSGYAVHSPMTPAQLRALQTFFDNVGTAIGRPAFAETLTAIGDSYVAAAPVGPSVAANDWVAIAATAKGWPYSLAGISGIGYAAGTSFMSSGVVGQNQLFKWILQAPTKRVVFPLGLNDADHAGTDTAARTEMNVILDMLAAVGYPTNYIAMATPCQASEVVDQVLLAAVAQAVRDAATAYGLRLIDFYSGRTNGQLSMELVDHLHKNDSGHAAMALDFADNIAASPWN